MSTSLNLRDHKTEAAPKESENIARAYCWLKSERNWKPKAPVAKVLMTFSTEELADLADEAARGEGMVKLTLTLWKSDFPETSDGWSPDIPEIDDYEKPRQQVVSKEMPSGVSITV